MLPAMVMMLYPAKEKAGLSLSAVTVLTVTLNWRLEEGERESSHHCTLNWWLEK